MTKFPSPLIDVHSIALTKDEMISFPREVPVNSKIEHRNGRGTIPCNQNFDQLMLDIHYYMEKLNSHLFLGQN